MFFTPIEVLDIPCRTKKLRFSLKSADVFNTYAILWFFGCVMEIIAAFALLANAVRNPAKAPVLQECL